MEGVFPGCCGIYWQHGCLPALNALAFPACPQVARQIAAKQAAGVSFDAIASALGTTNVYAANLLYGQVRASYGYVMLCTCSLWTVETPLRSTRKGLVQCWVQHKHTPLMLTHMCLFILPQAQLKPSMAAQLQQLIPTLTNDDVAEMKKAPFHSFEPKILQVRGHTGSYAQKPTDTFCNWRWLHFTYLMNASQTPAQHVLKDLHSDDVCRFPAVACAMQVHSRLSTCI